MELNSGGKLNVRKKKKTAASGFYVNMQRGLKRRSTAIRVKNRDRHTKLQTQLNFHEEKGVGEVQVRVGRGGYSFFEVHEPDIENAVFVGQITRPLMVTLAKMVQVDTNGDGKMDSLGVAVDTTGKRLAEPRVCCVLDHFFALLYPLWLQEMEGRTRWGLCWIRTGMVRVIPF